jgi:DNA end-binding protein Ku
MWKGVLHAGSQEVPVKLVAAVQDRDVHFHMLDRRGRSRVKQSMVDPDSGRETEASEIRKAYEVEPGVFVALNEEELAKIAPEPSRDIELLFFLPSGTIHHQWYERPYYLAPDGDAESYYALREALEKQNKEAVAKWVMRGRRYFGALRPEPEGLVLISMRHTDEVLLPKELPAPTGRTSTAKEVKIARQLIEMLEGPFDPSEFHDDYRQRLEDWLQARAKGKRPALAQVKTRRASGSLEDDLARSLEVMQGGRNGHGRKAA